MRYGPNRAVRQAASRRLDAIVVGERYRRDPGDLAALAASGHPTFTLAGHTTLLKGPFHVRKGAHSTKPIEAYDWFESLVPSARYFDLFSRYQHNERWDCHGFEAPQNALTDRPDTANNE
jgi:N6-adenosine-specific RNA methylase IME4